MEEQKYDEQQIGAILQRATEIQAEITPDAHGMTLPELQKVAAEVGIEPHVVERAAREVGIQAIQPKPLDASSAQMFDATVDGELSDEAWDDLVMSLRRFTGRPGATTVQGTTREWIDGSDVSSVSLTASSRNGRTRLRMLSDHSGAEGIGWVIGSTVGIFATIISGVLAGKGGLGPLLTTLAAASAFLMFGFTTYFGARAWRKKARKSSAEMFAVFVSQAQGQEIALRLPEHGVSVDGTEDASQTVGA